MIKLIATDVDGTLVKDSTPELYEELIQAIQTLSDQGIQFVVASGRQYASIQKMFAPVERNLIYIAENGAHIKKDGKDFLVKEMNRIDVEEIMYDLRKFYPECHVVASTARGCFLETKNQEFIDLIRYGYRNEITLVDDILAVSQPIIKLAIYKKDTMREIGESILIPKWKNRVKTCMAGDEWVDFMDRSGDKGNALKIVQQELMIDRKETMSFGDNHNDLGLIMEAEHSYAVENAVLEVRELAKNICPSYQEKGVYQILRSLYE